MTDSGILYKNRPIESLGVEELQEFVEELVKQQIVDQATISILKERERKLWHSASYGRMRVGLKISEIGKDEKNKEDESSDKVPTDL